MRKNPKRRCAQDDSATVILRNVVTKNPVCRRTYSDRQGSPFYGRDPRVPRRDIAYAQDDTLFPVILRP